MADGQEKEIKGKEQVQFTPEPFSIAEEQAAGKLPFGEIYYEHIPRLSTADILPGCGFDNTVPGYSFTSSLLASKKYFLQSIVRALQNPDWLFIEKGSPEYERRVKENLPRPQKFRSGNIEKLKKMIKIKDLSEVAKVINSAFDGFAGIEKTDIVARALEVMATDHPNLMMFRGTSLSSSLGLHYAPGDLEAALSYLESSAYTGRRRAPVLAMIKFSNFISEYTRGHVSIGTEADWWRGSLVINPDRDTVDKLVRLRRPPATEAETKAILEVYRKEAIPSQG